MKLTLMSFNTQHCMNYITKQIDFKVMADAIRKCNADIVGLNEMRDLGADTKEYQAQAKILAEDLGYYYYFAKAIDFSGVNPYGNAIVSKYPIISAETIIIPDPKERKYNGYYETRCVLKAKIDINGKELTILITHFGLNPDEVENGVDTVIANIKDENCVFMGDLNLTPEDALLTPIREKLYDTAQLFKEPLLSFPSDNPRIKIDYIFTSNDVKVLSADIPAIVASDHRPHIAEIDF